MKNYLMEITLIIIGSFFFAAGVNFFAIPNELGEGGITGISMILYYLFEWSPGLTTLLFNAVLLAAGYKLLEKRVTLYTILSILFTSFFLHWITGIEMVFDESILGTIFAGVFIGIGIGLVLRGGGTTGGSTILAKFANQYFGWGMSTALLIFDSIVVFSSYFVIGIENTMFTILSIYISTKVIDYIIDGLNMRKAVTVISKKAPQIAGQINEELDRGVTILPARGHFTQESREILYIVINKQELFKFKKIVHHIDPKAFVVIHDVRDVFGEGFSYPKSALKQSM
ncbi:YitT family protein [Domibacillus indicus]|uniref:YitT family protein n=1 Tax=Domibacillus indicus TaxID=1437523 RepID=UPI00203EFDC5|nr:YitT family protein [Domibacillus indicus]MCM3789907.1 YitT family protein [Domibacillus indicus]